jgi:hypothetical protein
MLKKMLMGAGLALSLAAPGCSLESAGCTELGCASTFSVAFQRAGGWPAGSYRVTVVADGETFACTATMPLQCNAPPACPSSAGIIIGLSGCALDPSQQSITGVEFLQGKAPQSVTVSVHQDDVLLGEGTYTPSYTESQPNGPDCEPTCKSGGSEELTLQ